MLVAESIIRQPGYVYVFLSNEGQSQQQIGFDDMLVEHVHSSVIQHDEYYSFGLTYNSFSRENTVTNKYLYSGKEKQDELGLGWMDYGARMYMTDIGRWGVIDPMGEYTNTLSPYHYAYNNPILFIDPDGMFARYNWGSGQYEDTDEDGNTTAVSWGEVQSQIKNGDGIRAKSKIKGEGNIAVWNYLSSTENSPKQVDVGGMDAGNENWDILQAENGDLQGVLLMMQAYKKLSLAVNNVAIAQHGNNDRMAAVQDEYGLKQNVKSSSVKDFLAGNGSTLMNKHLGQLQQIAKGIATGGNLFFLSCFAGSNGAEGGLPDVLGNMLLKANRGLNVWMPIGAAWAGVGKREIRFGSKGVGTTTNIGWTLINKTYSKAPLQTAIIIQFNKTGAPFTWKRK